MIFEPAARGHRCRVLGRSRRRPYSARVHSERRARRPDRVQTRSGRGLRSRRLQGAPLGRQVPRRRLVGARVRNRGPCGVPRGASRQPAEAARSPMMKIEVVTEGEYLGTIIGDVNRRRGQVTDQGQKGNAGHGLGLRAAGRDVRLHQLPALGDERPRHVHDGVRSLRRSAGGPGARSSWTQRLSRPTELVASRTCGPPLREGRRPLSFVRRKTRGESRRRVRQLHGSAGRERSRVRACENPTRSCHGVVRKKRGTPWHSTTRSRRARRLRRATPTPRRYARSRPIAGTPRPRCLRHRCGSCSRRAARASACCPRTARSSTSSRAAGEQYPISVVQVVRDQGRRGIRRVRRCSARREPARRSHGRARHRARAVRAASRSSRSRRTFDGLRFRQPVGRAANPPPTDEAGRGRRDALADRVRGDATARAARAAPRTTTSPSTAGGVIARAALDDRCRRRNRAARVPAPPSHGGSCASARRHRWRRQSLHRQSTRKRRRAGRSKTCVHKPTSRCPKAGCRTRPAPARSSNI